MTEPSETLPVRCQDCGAVIVPVTDWTHKYVINDHIPVLDAFPAEARDATEPTTLHTCRDDHTGLCETHNALWPLLSDRCNGWIAEAEARDATPPPAWPRVSAERVAELADELSNYGLGLNERALSEMAYDIVRHLAVVAQGQSSPVDPPHLEADDAGSTPVGLGATASHTDLAEIYADGYRIGSEARDATGLREALESVERQLEGNVLRLARYYWPKGGHIETMTLTALETLRAALAAAPQEPRTITEKVDAIEASIHPEGRCVKCGGGKPYWKHIDTGQPVADFHEFQPLPEPRWPSATPENVEALRAAMPDDWTEFWVETGNEDARDGFKQVTFDRSEFARAILAALRGERP